jgi:hypothetical protein
MRPRHTPLRTPQATGAGGRSNERGNRGVAPLEREMVLPPKAAAPRRSRLVHLALRPRAPRRASGGVARPCLPSPAQRTACLALMYLMGMGPHFYMLMGPRRAMWCMCVRVPNYRHRQMDREHACNTHVLDSVAGVRCARCCCINVS